MPRSQKNHTQELNRLEQLIYTGHFQEALQGLEILEQQKDLSPIDHLTCRLLKSRLLTRLGEYKKGLQLAKAVYKESQQRQKRLQIVDAIIVMSETLDRLGKIDEGLNAIEKGEYELILLENEHPTEVPLRKASILLRKGNIFWKKGNLDQALEFCQQSLSIFETLDHKYHISVAHNNLGVIYYEKGDLDRALESYQQSLILRKELGHKQAIAISLNNLGNLYIVKGDLDRGLEYHQQSLALRKELGNKHYIATSLNNLGMIFHLKGELDHALEYLQQCLILWEELGNKHYIAEALNNLGSIYSQKGELDPALVYLEQSLTLREELGNNFYTAHTLFQLISVTIDKTTFEKTKRYLQRLHHINDQENNKVISQRYRVAEAMLLKTSTRARSRGKAEELFEQVVEEEIIDHELMVIALLNLCDLLLIELRSSDEPEVLNEVKTHVTKLLEIAKQQQSHWLLTEVYVLQSKLSLVELDIQGARRFLDQAQFIAEERGLRRLAMQISNEHDILLNQLSQWEDFIDRRVSLAERSELARLEEQVVRMIRKRTAKLPEPSQEEPELLVIIGADSGLSMFSKTFHCDRSVQEHLIAGFLTAINAFIRDAFAVRGSIERIKHQEYTILLQPIDPFLVCYVFKGPSYFALQKLSQFTEALQASEMVWRALTDALQAGRVPRVGMAQQEVEELVTEIFRISVE